MFDKFTRPKITKEYILKHVTEEQIFERYLGIRPDYRTQFRNPLREDTLPGCVFYIDKFDRIKFCDYSRNWNWDCFNVVEYLFKVDFKEAMNRIAVDFGLTDGTVSPIAQAREQRKKEKIELRVKFREWNKEDKEYWFDQYYLTSEDLRQGLTFPISHAWYMRDGVLDPQPFYEYKSGDPCYAYCFPEYGQFEYKLYFPKRTHNRRFRQTRGDIIQGLAQLPSTGHILIITKSKKDSMVINKFGRKIDAWGIASMSESQMMPKELVKELLLRFDYVFTLFDFDRTGITLMRQYENTYNIRGFLFGSEYRKGIFKLGRNGIKDISDHVEIRKKEETEKLIKHFYEVAINS